MNNEEIVIKTEVVKVEDLQGRDKQIYDYAYKKAYNEAMDKNKVIIAMTIYRSSVLIAAALLVFLFAKSCAQ